MFWETRSFLLFGLLLGELWIPRVVPGFVWVSLGHMGELLKRNPKHLPMDCAWLYCRRHS